ncbi:MAG TPA: bifunctional diaminohydroxyphosphoribosylaminopyrimidine deaminase/5-amino-6-(5-phosphoribosylamino)uracil reductase RibD [Pirellulaceae bacterium]|jgi:diaminohydroxyphosphoribosylaminopyrimidine deaminase/5-amino-6-(5-phosphoribosylamino)uracil reductase|nr:bifunctional diaminohydroxyphosphoribosylaminopyrimidine deaminase/5-amino-6-(5-phosphoribosylamino)uracil reductase RibD [Pirellulaceae bacterium]
MTDADWMRIALQAAARGVGHVEPNPPVGCVLVRDGRLLVVGRHRRFGGDHAEVDALRQAGLGQVGAGAAGATAYVTLEPCRHFGKTPPCTRALIEARVARVVVALTDPFPQVAGGGIRELREAGIAVETGVLEREAASLLAPYLKRLRTGRPWVHAKWAATWDGRIAAPAGDSKWITSEASRARVHELRGRMDAIVVGIGTVLADNPQLTVRPPGPRTPTRVVFDSKLRSPVDSVLVRTARETPTLIVCGKSYGPADRKALEERGVSLLPCSSDVGTEMVREALDELGRRGMTNLFVEGGPRLLGSFFDAGEVDEVHAFLAPKLIGSAFAPGPIGGSARGTMADAVALEEVRAETIGDDVYLRGRVAKKAM